MSTQLANIHIVKYWTAQGPKVEAIDVSGDLEAAARIARSRARRWNTVAEVHTIQASKIIYAHDALDPMDPGPEPDSEYDHPDNWRQNDV